MSRSSLRLTLVWPMLCLGIAGACARPTASAQGVARAFVDHFFVQVDHEGTLPLTTGLARAKVEEEMRLLGQQPPGTAAERPRIYYRQVDEQIQDDARTFSFRLTVVVPGDQPVEPSLMVHVRRNGGIWRVSNYKVWQPGTQPATARQ